jgi:hypothetical protein
MADLRRELHQEFTDLSLAKNHFPNWLEWGIEDEFQAIHSLGLSYLVTVGQSLGYVSCAEVPLAGGRVRADGVWWARDTRQPVALFEFERHKSGDELVSKTRNLMRAWHACQVHPNLLGLVFWTPNFYACPDSVLRPIWQDLSQGFLDDDRVRIPGVPADLLVVYECVHLPHGKNRLILKGFNPRRRA